MIPTGSRLLIGATLLSIVAAIIYGTTVSGSLGTTGLISLSVAFGVITAINLFTRDADVSVKDPTAATESAAAHHAPRPSIWPIVAGGGGVLLVLGLITYPVVFIFGVIALLAATIEWMIEAWSERASGDVGYNAGVRERIAHPAEMPVLALLATGVIVYSFSRIMLFLSKTGGPIVFGVLAALVLAVGAAVAYRPQLRNATVQAVAAVAVLGLVAGGVAAALAGPRDIETHETTGALATHGECETPDETHADNNASQTIGAKANVHGEIILRSDGTLVARTIGIPGDHSAITITRSNPTNIIFRNESDDDRRLVLLLGEATAAEGADSGADAGESTDAEHAAREQLCTALAEADGSQLLTFEIGAASSETNHFEFVVPGVDNQSVEVIVP
ncbi:hypothetical protein [Desertimonas flava]|uniref:hypothetical protein n=1 Tax=Desertimonas flava TaxID=2064846 RepID=UPI000E34ABBA|nr:hypothetical protein [Desertimonas flava]